MASSCSMTEMEINLIQYHTTMGLKIKHLAMQSAFTNMCHSAELSEFKHGTVVGCHFCNKSVCEISSLLDIPRSTVSGIIGKWTRLGANTTQP